MEEGERVESASLLQTILELDYRVERSFAGSSGS